MSKKLTIDDFIKRSIDIHGDEYNYSKVDYINNKTKVIIICKKHGVFTQRPINHINNKTGCPKCYGNNKMNTNGFIKRSMNIHNSKYDYSEVNYINNKTEVNIICKEHGRFLQTPLSHLNGHGCFKCANGNDLKTFIEKANKIYDDKYDYSESVYINSLTPIKIICKTHGDFITTPSNFISNKNGCIYCNGFTYKNLYFFKQDANRIHNNKYEYEIIDDLKKISYIKIICPEHGEFKQRIESHINNKRGCRKCVFNSMVIPFDKILERFNKVHNNKYDYSKVNYINTYTKISIVCEKHGIFNQLPKSHMKGEGCPNCHISKGENIIKEILENKKISIITQKTFDGCENFNKLKFDFYLPEFNICIEYDGIQHFESHDFFGGDEEFRKVQKRDRIKNNYCKDNNIKLIRIPYWDFDNIKEIITKEVN